MLERIYVEIGNICNLSCDFCTGTTRPKRQMNDMEFSLVCEKIKNRTKYMYLHVMGEPLFHPRFDNFLKIAQEKAIPVCITTNGLLLAEKKNIILENANILHKISVSLHSMEGNDCFEYKDYLNNSITFAKEAAQKGIYIVFRLWNRDSKEAQGKNSRNSDIETILHNEFKNEWQARPRGYRLAKNIFLEYDGVFIWPTESKAEEVNEGFCHALSSQIAILADGTVVPCCLDANGEISLGNIFQNTLDEILSGNRATAIRDGFASGKIVDPLCKKCTFARKFKKRSN